MWSLFLQTPLNSHVFSIILFDVTLDVTINQTERVVCRSGSEDWTFPDVPLRRPVTVEIHDRTNVKTNYFFSEVENSPERIKFLLGSVSSGCTCCCCYGNLGENQWCQKMSLLHKNEAEIWIIDRNQIDEGNKHMIKHQREDQREHLSELLRRTSASVSSLETRHSLTLK